MTAEDYNQAVADALTGAYKSRRLKQEVLAARAEMSIWTLQKKLKGRAPVTATDLVMLARAIGVPASLILDEADRLEEERASDNATQEYAPSDPPPTVEDNVTYLGHVTPDLSAAADGKDRAPGRD